MPAWVIYMLVSLLLIAVGWALAPKGWRTYIVNALIGAPPILLGLMDFIGAANIPWAQIFPPDSMPTIIAVYTAINGVLRRITTTPAGRATATPQTVAEARQIVSEHVMEKAAEETVKPIILNQ